MIIHHFYPDVAVAAANLRENPEVMFLLGHLGVDLGAKGYWGE